MGKMEGQEDNQQEIQDWIKEDQTDNRIELKHPVRFWIIFTIVVGTSLACAIGGIQIVYQDFMHNKANLAVAEQTTETQMTETQMTEVISDNTEKESQTTEEPKETQKTETYITGGGVGNGQMICIDAGHQSSADNAKEPNGPGSSSMKARVTGGTQGTTTGVYEYQLNLEIASQLQTELEKRGYKVCMTRTTHDVNISNMERAQYATSAGADICIRIHANGADVSSASGAMALAPSTSNPYVSNLAADSQSLSKAILDSYCAETGMRNRGVTSSDTMTGINWCTMPVTILEMGYMTNSTDDTNMQNRDYQIKMVQGIANGVDSYFSLNK